MQLVELCRCLAMMMGIPGALAHVLFLNQVLSPWHRPCAVQLITLSPPCSSCHCFANRALPAVSLLPSLQFITLLFTDLGVLTPAAVSDELIQLYV